MGYVVLGLLFVFFLAPLSLSLSFLSLKLKIKCWSATGTCPPPRFHYLLLLLLLPPFRKMGLRLQPPSTRMSFKAPTFSGKSSGLSTIPFGPNSRKIPNFDFWVLVVSFKFLIDPKKFWCFH